MAFRVARRLHSTLPATNVVSSITKGGVCALILNRPKARNALSAEMLRSFQLHLHEAVASSKVRCIIVKGNGPAFCSGHDLKEMVMLREQAKQAGGEPAQSDLSKVFELCSSVMQDVANCPKPVIAQVHGIATAAGCQLVASADLAIASSNARFATPGVDIGLFCSTPSVALSRCIGRKNSMWMLMTGEMIGAEKAQQWGLVNRVVEEEELEEETARVAKLLASKSTEAIAFGKNMFDRQINMPLEGAYTCASEVMVTNMLAEDAGEGIGAFLEKRRPRWPSHDGPSKL